MKWRSITVAALCLVLAGVYWLNRLIPPTPKAAMEVHDASNAVVVTSNSSQNPVAAQLPGEMILDGYGTAAVSPEEDLRMVLRLMDTSILLLKSAAERPLGCNEDWAAMLLGANAAKERFLPTRHPAIDGQQRLVDRWNTPFFIHARGSKRFDIRSAGPDRKMWTSDDIHIQADGTVHLGAQMPTQMGQK